MNKNFWKRFLTWNPHHNDGFTLVELIVVIAILAILAAVAVPAYSGYIEKANRAGDETLLAAVNRAFTSACLDNGVDPYTLSAVDAKIELAKNKTIDMDKFKPAYMKAAFELYFEGNKDAQFKSMNSLVYVKAMGMFLPVDAAGNVQLTYGGAKLDIPQELVDMADNSTFLKAETLGGTDGLLNKVASVTDVALVLQGQGGNAGNLLNGVIGSEGFLMFAAESLGIDPTDDAAFAAKGQAIIAEMKASGKYEGKTDAELQQIFMTNAAVLYAANEATQMSREDIMASLTVPGEYGVKDNIIANIGTETTKAFSQATMAYGMYTAWAHATGNQEAMDKDELDVMNDLNNTEFQSWLKTDQAQKDLDGYLAALEIINSSSTDSDAVSKLVANGFGDQTLKDAVGGLFEEKP